MWRWLKPTVVVFPSLKIPTFKVPIHHLPLSHWSPFSLPCRCKKDQTVKKRLVIQAKGLFMDCILRYTWQNNRLNLFLQLHFSDILVMNTYSYRISLLRDWIQLQCTVIISYDCQLLLSAKMITLHSLFWLSTNLFFHDKDTKLNWLVSSLPSPLSCMMHHRGICH